MRQKHQRLRLQELNRFDIERILREVLETLDIENDKILQLIDSYTNNLGQETLSFLIEEIQNNSAQSIHITSLLSNQDDVFSYLSDSPLVRKEETN